MERNSRRWKPTEAEKGSTGELLVAVLVFVALLWYFFDLATRYWYIILPLVVLAGMGKAMEIYNGFSHSEITQNSTGHEDRDVVNPDDEDQEFELDALEDDYENEMEDLRDEIDDLRAELDEYDDLEES